MGYCTKTEATQILANALTSGNPELAGPIGITTIGNSVTSTVPDAVFNQFIRWADSQINASISSIYSIPLKRVNIGSFNLAMDVTAGDMYVVLEDASFFLPEDVVLLRDSTNWEEFTILTINDTPSPSTLHFSVPVVNSYLYQTTKIERIRYPDPIPNIAAHLTASRLYDKYFAAQVEGNKSEYGKELYAKGINELNQVLSGAIRLYIGDAHRYKGRRYYNMALDDAPFTKAEPGKKWFGTD